MTDRHDPKLQIARWEPDTTLWRIHPPDHPPLWFGPEPGAVPAGRFDAPAGEYPICYLGASPAAAFVETLLRGRRRRLVSRDTLRSRALARISLCRALVLAQLHGRGLPMLGVGSDTIHGAEYEASRRVALGAFEQDPAVDGVCYRSRWDDAQLCVGLFDRARQALAPVAGSEQLDRSEQIRELLAQYEVGVI